MSRLDAQVSLTRGSLEVDCRITADSGTTAVVVGPNGAGKSTVADVVAGHLRIDRGMVAFGDVVWDQPATSTFVPASERSVGMVHQDLLLFPHMTVLENLVFGLEARRVPGPEAERRAAQWLGTIEVAPGRRPGDLSGGQAQRVALARALISEPSLLILDEPLSALDATARTRLRRVLRDHLESFPGPRLWITHDPAEAAMVGDVVHVVEEGRVTQSAAPAEIRLAPATPYVADLVGTNLFTGQAGDGSVNIGGHSLAVAASGYSGPVAVVIHPRAIALHAERPRGSPRNVWQTRVETIENLGDRVRLQTGAPLPLVAEVTPAALAELSLAKGSPVWVSIKATEIGVQPG